MNEDEKDPFEALVGVVEHTDKWLYEIARKGPYRCRLGHTDTQHWGGYCIACRSVKTQSLVWTNGEDQEGYPIHVQPYKDLPEVEGSTLQCAECDEFTSGRDYLCRECRAAA